MDASQQKVESDVQEFGWHVVLVSPSEGQPAFAFTIGLFRNYQHPEVIVFGLPEKAAHSILNLIGKAVKGGRRINSGDRSREFLQRYECTFVSFPRYLYADHLGYAQRFYGGDDFPALQCVWPDREGRYPWEPGAPAELKREQPVPGKLSGTTP